MEGRASPASGFSSGFNPWYWAATVQRHWDIINTDWETRHLLLLLHERKTFFSYDPGKDL